MNAAYYSTGYRNGYRRRAAPKPQPNAEPEVVQTWKDTHPHEFGWMERAARRDNDFACSLLAALNRYGSLTERQLEAVRRCLAGEAAQREREANAPTVTVAPLETCFERARQAGVRSANLRLAEFVFVPAGQRSANPGAIYVKDRHNDTYLGKIKDGRFVRVRDCNEETEASVLRVCSDPHSAAIAYGKRYGVCSCCGRTLEDPKSIAKGIGPICERSWFNGEYSR